MSSFDRILPFIPQLKPYIFDQSVTEIMVNRGGAVVFIERQGTLEQTDLVLEPRNLLVALKNIARALGDDIGVKDPLLDSRLEDGSRVSAAWPTVSHDGATLTIRKFGTRYTLQDLMASGSVPCDVGARLAQAILTQKNLLISGATASGKTTCLNALADLIPSTERIVLIEDTSEIFINKPNLVRFEAQHAQTDAAREVISPDVTISHLLKHTLRHRPDRIILGEIRGAEGWDVLQALNTGHQGSMSTIHANSAEQALIRWSHLVLMANVGLPHESVCEAIALAMHLVVHVGRDEEGRRRVKEVVEIEGYDTGTKRFVVKPVYQLEKEYA